MRRVIGVVLQTCSNLLHHKDSSLFVIERR
nr:MAG TPA: hypothetical protein [Bacteriophage sp.]